MSLSYIYLGNVSCVLGLNQLSSVTCSLIDLVDRDSTANRFSYTADCYNGLFSCICPIAYSRSSSSVADRGDTYTLQLCYAAGH